MTGDMDRCLWACLPENRPIRVGKEHQDAIGEEDKPEVLQL